MGRLSTPVTPRSSQNRRCLESGQPKLCQGNFSIPDPPLWCSSATADVEGGWRGTDEYGDGKWQVVSFPIGAAALLVGSFCLNS